MKTLKRNSFIKALVILMVCCVCGFVLSTFGMGSASANATVSDKLIMQGASIRFQQEGETAQDSTAGIRFESRIKKSDYNTETGLQNVTEVGIILVPVSENVSDANFVVGTTGVAKVVIQGGDENLNNAFSIKYLGEDYYSYRVYIYNIPASQYFNQIKARAYAVCDGETLYSEIATRSIAEVANTLLDDVDTEESEEYPYQIADGVYSKFDANQRIDLAKYFENAPAPEFSASATLPAKAHMGETITLPTYTAIDWTGADAQVDVSVSQDGNAVAVEGNKFTVASYADHVITVTITDSNGVITTKSYTISVYEENFACSFAPEYHFIKTCGEVEIGDNTVHALGIQMKKGYNYANTGFAYQGDWANEYVSFKAYNPTSYTVKFAIWATKELREYASTEWANQYVELTGLSLEAGATQEVVLDDWYDFESYPYVAIYMQAADNGGASSEQHINTKFYIYDCEIIKAERVDPTNTADYKYAQGTGRNMTIETNTDTTYVKDGAYSLKMVVGGTSSVYGWISETANVDMTTMESVSFSIYNSAEVDLPIYVGLGTSSSNTWLSDSLRVEILPKKAWKDITVRLDTLEGITAGLALGISTSYDLYETDSVNSTYNTYVNGKARLYLDNFQFTQKTTSIDMSSEDYLWAKGAGSQHYSHVNTNTAYCVDGSLYSWNILATGSYPASYNAYSATINWNDYKTLTFQVYNATDYALTFVVRIRNAANSGDIIKQSVTAAAKTWTTVTMDFSGKTFEVGGKFGVSAEWGSNKVNGSTTYQNAYNPIWYGFKTQGIYLDGFTLVEKDYDSLWTEAVNGSMGSFSRTVNTDSAYIKEGSKSLLAKPNGTWNTLAFSYALQLDTSAITSITFEVYNPNDFDVVVGVGTSWATFVAKKGEWTTVTVTDFTAITAGKGLEIKVGVGQSITIDGTTYTNPTDGTDEFTALKTNGLYFDNFVVA